MLLTTAVVIAGCYLFLVWLNYAGLVAGLAHTFHIIIERVSTITGRTANDKTSIVVGIYIRVCQVFLGISAPAANHTSTLHPSTATYCRTQLYYPATTRCLEYTLMPHRNYSLQVFHVVCVCSTPSAPTRFEDTYENTQSQRFVRTLYSQRCVVIANSAGETTTKHQLPWLCLLNDFGSRLVNAVNCQSQQRCWPHHMMEVLIK